MNARILIVDDHEVVRQGVRSLLSEARPNLTICGEASSGADALEAIKSLKPDLVVLDITLPQMSGLEVASRINKLGLACRLLMFTMHESVSLAAEVRATGAHGLVLKSQASRNLVNAIDTLLTGGTFFGPSEGKTKPEKAGTANGGIVFRTLLGWPLRWLATRACFAAVSRG